jgi:hypothetical protein
LNENSSSNQEFDDTFYDSEPLERELLYQGEIVIETPIFQMPQPSRWLVLRTQSNRRVDEALNYGAVAKENRVRVLDSNQFPLEWKDSQLGDFVVGILDKSPAIVLSQNCDIANKEYIQIAPIIPVSATDTDLLDKLKRHAIINAFYMKPHPPEWETDAYVEFQLIQSVHRTYVKTIESKNHFRLSTAKVLLLQRDLTRFFGRPNCYDVNSDTVPRDGEYLCLGCFYWRATITKVVLKSGGSFPLCDKCEGGQWVPRLAPRPAS